MKDSYEILDWDSNFFGFKVARINLDHTSPVDLDGVFEEIKKERVRLVYLSSPVRLNNDQSISLNYSGVFVDEKITYVKDIEEACYNCENIIKFEQLEPTSQMISLAYESGVYSRFKVDDKIGSEKFEELYKLWIENSVNKSIASDVLIYSKNSQILGLITLGEKNSVGDIGIVSVDARARGIGIGKELIYSAISLFEKNGYSKVQVVTQGDNIPACKLYERCGFNVEKVEYLYHYWQK
jgi:dTDP-4-amino-4,6-dideoxy-D-galactose acyltransferase